MSASQIRAGQAYVEISTKRGLFDKGLNAVRRSLHAFTKSASFIGRGVASGIGGAQKVLGGFASRVFNLKNALVGSFAVAGIGKLITDFAAFGSEIYDMSKRTGMGAEAISGLAYAAKLSGASIDDVEKATRTMSKTIAKAAGGNKEAKKALSALGLTADQLKGMTPEQQFLALAEQVSKIPDQATKAATAMRLFGKSGTMLLPMMANGAKGIEGMMAEARNMGQTMGDEDASAADALGDSMDILWGSITAVRNAIGASLAPMLTDLATRARENIAAVQVWINQNRGMIIVAAQVAAGIAVAGAALLAIAGTAAVVSAALGVAAGIAGIVGTAFTVMGAIIGAIFTPIGLIIVGIAALGVAILYYSGAGGAMIEYLGASFQSLLGFVMPVIDGIKEALMSGQFAAAGKVLFTALEIAFRTGTQSLYGIWLDLGVLMQNTWTDVWGFITDNFGGIVNGISSIWETTVNQIAKSLLYLYSLFDRSVDYEAAAKALDDEAKAKKKEREKAGFLSVDEREKLKQERLDQAAGKKDQFAGRIDELKDELADSLAEIHTVAEEKAAAAEAEKAKLPELPSVGNFNLPSLGQVAQKATQVTGTFSGFAAGLLGGGVSMFDRLVDETVKTNELLSEVAANTEDMGLEVGA